jgi:hypothetical protein
MSDPKTARVQIMNLIEGKLKDHEKWAEIKPELAIQCSNLIEPTNEDLKNKLIDDLYKIRNYLQREGFKNLDFLKGEISSYSNTVQISLYEETDDVISRDVISQYSRLSHNKEGVIGISQKFNYDQIRKLTNGVFRETGLVKFYISKEKIIPGKIVAEIYEHPQSIPIASLINSKKMDDSGDSSYQKIVLFGDKYNPKEYAKIKEIKVPLYVYKFISDQNKEMMVFSIEKMMVGDYMITGMETECDDYKMLTASSKLATKLPFFFIQSAKSRITLFSNRDELKTKLQELNVGYETMYNYIFSTKIKNKNYLLKYHSWFKNLMWAWLIHKPKGLKQTYPMHLYIAGPRATGKSMIIENIHEKVRETNEIFSGVSSTLKKLVPSFKYMPIQHGYLAESNRFAFCDEFLRCIVNAKSNNANSDRDESVGMMNDLLEHKKRVVGSGVSSGTVVMKARTLAVSNPVRGTNNMTDLLENLDESFLSRWLIYYQGEDDIELVRKSDDDDLPVLDYNMDDHDLVSIIDYMHQIDAEYDRKRLVSIFEESRPLLSYELAQHYDSRQKHHIECLMDGLIKTRCIMNQEVDFVAKEEDYEQFRIIWTKIVKSWIDFKEIRKLHVSKRIYYMPEISQYLYDVICKQKKEMTRDEIYELVSSEMSKREFTTNLIILVSNEVLGEFNDKIKPYWFQGDWGARE